MKPQVLAGLLLVILGIVLLVFQGIPFMKKNTADLGPLKLEEKHEETFPVSPAIGVASLAGGIFLVVLGSKK